MYAAETAPVKEARGLARSEFFDAWNRLAAGLRSRASRTDHGDEDGRSDEEDLWEIHPILEFAVSKTSLGSA
jgi:hypothetical protein